MSEDDKYGRLFAGVTGSVLGEFKDPKPDSGAAKAKMRAAKEKRLPPSKPARGRVPPGQEVVSKWPVLDLGYKPAIPADQWRLEFKGAVERPVSVSWTDFLGLPQARIKADIHCVTAWSMLDNIWEGVSAKTLIGLARPRATVRHVVFHSHDGYRTNVAFDQFSSETALLAHSHNGTPISREHGGPVRVVIPSLYFWKSAKWIQQITFLEQDVKGYWEALGYHNNGDPWKEERFE